MPCPGLSLHPKTSVTSRLLEIPTKRLPMHGSSPTCLRQDWHPYPPVSGHGVSVSSPSSFCVSHVSHRSALWALCLKHRLSPLLTASAAHPPTVCSLGHLLFQLVSSSPPSPRPPSPCPPVYCAMAESAQNNRSSGRWTKLAPDRRDVCGISGGKKTAP